MKHHAVGSARFSPQDASQPDDNNHDVRSRVTDFVSAGWIGVVCYRACDMLHAGPAEHATVWAWAGLIATFIAAFACLQRWRWGRWAVLGMAICVLADATAGAIRCAGPDGLLSDGFRGFLRWSEDVLEAYGCGEPVGAFIIGLAAITFGWLCTTAAHWEFERRKRAKTRRLQFGLAGALLAIFLVGVSGSGIAGRVGAHAARIAEWAFPGVAMAPASAQIASRLSLSAHPIRGQAQPTSAPGGRR